MEIQDLRVNAGKWRIVDKLGKEYIVDISALSNWEGGSVDGWYSVNNEPCGVGVFPFKDIVKMEKVLTKENCVV